MALDYPGLVAEAYAQHPRLSEVISATMAEGLLMDPQFIEFAAEPGYRVVRFETGTPLQVWIAHERSIGRSMTEVDGVRVVSYQGNRIKVLEFTMDKAKPPAIKRCEELIKKADHEGEYDVLNDLFKTAYLTAYSKE